MLLCLVQGKITNSRKNVATGTKNESNSEKNKFMEVQKTNRL